MYSEKMLICASHVLHWNCFAFDIWKENKFIDDLFKKIDWMLETRKVATFEAIFHFLEEILGFVDQESESDVGLKVGQIYRVCCK